MIPKLNRDAVTVAAGETKKELVGGWSETARTALIYSDRRLPEREQIRADINTFIRIINICPYTDLIF